MATPVAKQLETAPLPLGSGAVGGLGLSGFGFNCGMRPETLQSWIFRSFGFRVQFIGFDPVVEGSFLGF